MNLSSSPLLGAVIGILLLGLIGFIPFFGGMIKAAAALLGLEAIFITKFGMGRPWRRRKAGVTGEAEAPPGA